ncbi:hypothetical protein, partial [Sphingomonas lacusdianchii]|uniref:hypothetical protein n=1 Tax=Sphingomonas lacusdianchii TaxID=2917992 RepID=UPI001F563D1A
GQSGRGRSKANQYGRDQVRFTVHELRLHTRKLTVTNLSTPPSRKSGQRTRAWAGLWDQSLIG